MELMKGSLNTFLNAMTFSDKTIYPVSSCNEKDFQNLMDVYMDAVLYPNILTNKKIFMQEGWHYEVDENGDLIYNGVVYNEMKGAFSSEDQILGRETQNSLFPDNPYGVESGGDPKSIPDLTYENFVKFYKKFYHPANSYIILYGNCNMEEKLKYLDEEYLSKFDKINPDSDIHPQAPFTETKEEELFYQLPEGQEMTDKTLMSYNVALPADMDIFDKFGLDILTSVLLNSNGAPLKEALLKANCAKVIEGDFTSDILQPIFSISGKGSNKETKELFVSTIENTLHDLVFKGLDKKAIEASLNILEFKLREADFGGLSKGLIYGINILSTWLYNDKDPFSSLDYTNIFNKLREYINTHYYEYLILKYLLKNKHKSVVLVLPSETAQSENEALVKEKLANFKASLTDEELEQIVNDTKELKEYQASGDTLENLATIPTLQREDISSEVKEESNVLNLFGETNVLHHNYNTSGIVYLDLMFKLNSLTQEELVLAGALKDLLFTVSTSDHSFLELDQDIKINTGGISASVDTLTDKEGNAHPFFKVSITSLTDKLDHALDLVLEVITSSDLSMKDKILEVLTQKSQFLTQMFVNGGNRTARTRALSYINDAALISDEVNGISYYDFLMNLLNNYEESFEEFKEKLTNVCAKLFNKNNLFCNVTCNDEEFIKSKDAINKFIVNVKDEEVNDVLTLSREIKNEGFKAPFNVNYNALSGDFKASGLEYNGSLDLVNNLLATDYLWQRVRVLGGAYGCSLDINPNGTISLVSYRDPKVKETFDNYHAIIEYLDNLDMSDSELFKFVIGAIGGLDYPYSPKVKGLLSLRNYYKGYTKEDQEKRRSELLSSTLEDVKASKKYFEAVFNQEVVCTIGNNDKVEENKELFKVTKNLLK